MVAPNPRNLGRLEVHEVGGEHSQFGDRTVDHAVTVSPHHRNRVHDLDALLSNRSQLDLSPHFSWLDSIVKNLYYALHS